MGELGIGATELAKTLGISRDRVYQLTREGKIARMRNGKYDLKDVRIALKRNLDIRRPAKSRGEKARPIQTGELSIPAPASQSLSLANVQLQHEIARATKAQFEVKRLKRILVDAAEVKQELSEMISAARSRALIIPSKLAPRLAAESDVRVCHAIIEEEIRLFLTALNEYEPSRQEPAA